MSQIPGTPVSTAARAPAAASPEIRSLQDDTNALIAELCPEMAVSAADLRAAVQRLARARGAHTSITLKQARLELELELKVPLKVRRAEIRAMLEEAIAERDRAAEAEDDDDAHADLFDEAEEEPISQLSSSAAEDLTQDSLVSNASPVPASKSATTTGALLDTRHVEPTSNDDPDTAAAAAAAPSMRAALPLVFPESVDPLRGGYTPVLGE